MDIGALSSQLAMNRNLTDVGTALLSKTMDNQEIQGEGIVKMIDSAAMERSVTPHIGGNFDMSV